MLCKCLLKKLARTMQSGLDGLGQEIEGRSGFLHTHALDDAGNEHRAEFVRQRIDCPLDNAEKL